MSGLFAEMHSEVFKGNHHGDRDHRKNKRAFGDKRRSMLLFWMSRWRHFLRIMTPFCGILMERVSERDKKAVYSGKGLVGVCDEISV